MKWKLSLFFGQPSPADLSFLSTMKNAKDFTLPFISFLSSFAGLCTTLQSTIVPKEKTAMCLSLFKFPVSKCLKAFWFLFLPAEDLCLEKLMVSPVTKISKYPQCRWVRWVRKATDYQFNLEKFPHF